VFLVIRVIREPWIDLDDQFLLLMPRVVQLFVVTAFVASGLAIALTFIAARAAAEPTTQLPPNVSVVSRHGRPARRARSGGAAARAAAGSGASSIAGS
jgi:hypothetical protein